jgi:hypothetical protein
VGPCRRCERGRPSPRAGHRTNRGGRRLRADRRGSASSAGPLDLSGHPPTERDERIVRSWVDEIVAVARFAQVDAVREQPARPEGVPPSRKVLLQVARGCVQTIPRREPIRLLNDRRGRRIGFEAPRLRCVLVADLPVADRSHAMNAPRAIARPLAVCQPDDRRARWRRAIARSVVSRNSPIGPSVSRFSSANAIRAPFCRISSTSA